MRVWRACVGDIHLTCLSVCLSVCLASEDVGEVVWRRLIIGAFSWLFAPFSHTSFFVLAAVVR